MSICAEVTSLLSEISINYCVSHDDISQDKLSSIPSSPFNYIVAIPLKLYPGEKALKLASLLTIKSFKTGRNVSRYPAIQFLLHLLSTRQIRNAVNIVRNLWKPPLLLLWVRDCSKVNCSTKLVEYLSEYGIKCDCSLKPEINLDTLSKVYGFRRDLSINIEEVILTKIAYSALIAKK